MNVQKMLMLPVGLLLLAGLAGCWQQEPQTVEDESEAIAELPKPPADEPSPESAAPHIERLVEAEKCFDVAGFEAYVFRFFGGFVECWIDVETDGTKEVLAKEDDWEEKIASVVEQARSVAKSQEQTFTLAPDSIHGYVIFMRRHDDMFAYAEESKGKWELVIVVKVGDEDTSSYLTTHNPVPLPFFEPSAEHKPGSSWFTSEGGRQGGLLQPDEELCLYECKWLETLKGNVTKERQHIRLKCRLVAYEPPN
jgi:hypothetical protein